jgi:SAM-dependent methyltransferase
VERYSPDPEAAGCFYHRKMWEFVYIAHALYERGMFSSGKRGLGFAVGCEPLPALFASFGCDILATDIQPENETADTWKNSQQHASGDLSLLNRYGLCPPEQFDHLVHYRNVNMNEIPDDLTGFDICWSSCAFEHLGSLENGLNFVRNAMNTLKPGGWAVHTTEFNCSSDDETLETPTLSLFRERDLRHLVQSLEEDGHHVEPLNLHSGTEAPDLFVDIPPFYRKRMFLKLYLHPFVSTSVGLIIQKKGLS